MTRHAQENLEVAKRAYRAATEAYWVQRESGGIVPLDLSIKADAEEHEKGVRFKCVTPAAAVVLGAWQKCKAELDAAKFDLQREEGSLECNLCPLPIVP